MWQKQLGGREERKMVERIQRKAGEMRAGKKT